MMEGDVTIRQAMNGFVVFQGSQHAILVFQGLHELIPYLCAQFDYSEAAVLEAMGYSPVKVVKE